MGILKGMLCENIVAKDSGKCGNFKLFTRSDGLCYIGEAMYE